MGRMTMDNFILAADSDGWRVKERRRTRPALSTKRRGVRKEQQLVRLKNIRQKEKKEVAVLRGRGRSRRGREMRRESHLCLLPPKSSSGRSHVVDPQSLFLLAPSQGAKRKRSSDAPCMLRSEALLKRQWIVPNPCVATGVSDWGPITFLSCYAAREALGGRRWFWGRSLICLWSRAACLMSSGRSLRASEGLLWRIECDFT